MSHRCRLSQRYLTGLGLGHPDGAGPLAQICHEVPKLVDAALADFDLRRASGAVWTIVDGANRFIEQVRPWERAKAGDRAGLDAALAGLVAACGCLADELAPLLPGAAAAIAGQCRAGPDGRLPAPQPRFARLAA